DGSRFMWAAPNIQRQFEQLDRLRNALGGGDLGGAEIQLGEDFERNVGRWLLGSGARGGRRGCRRDRSGPMLDQGRLAFRFEARKNRLRLGELAAGPAPFLRPGTFVLLAT